MLKKLPPKPPDFLREYYRAYKPIKYLIEGPNGKKDSGTSIANIVKRAAQKAKIKKHVKPHMLRHSRVGGPICDRSGGPHTC